MSRLFSVGVRVRCVSWQAPAVRVGQTGALTPPSDPQAPPGALSEPHAPLLASGWTGRRRSTSRRFLPVVVVLLAIAAPTARAQSAKPWARVSFTAQGVTAKDQGQALPGFTEVVTSIAFATPERDDGRMEYRLDVRGAGYPQSDERDPRLSIYDAYAGRTLAGGRLRVRLGQMWLNDLGSLGSLGGFSAEIIKKKWAGFSRVRLGTFLGLEPRILEVGYVSRVTKAGAYVALEGEGARRHVVGFVTLRNDRLTERSVLVTTNFVPLGTRALIYQSLEYDLTGPAGLGSGGLTYFFGNARVNPARWLELQGTYHRGRSVDARTITLDQLAGRPVSPRSLEGLLFESAGGRLTLTVPGGFRVFGGYARDRNNREDASTSRVTLGMFNANIFGTGIDVRASDMRIDGPGVSSDSWDASIGRNFGRAVYLSGDYASSLSSVLFAAFGDFRIVARPRTKRYGVTGLLRFTRSISLLLTGERLTEGSLEEWRWLSGVTYRY